MNSLRELEPFRAIAEYTYDWETWVDAQGKTRWVNAAVERITGYRVDECLAMPDYPLGLAHPDDRPLLARVLSEAARGESGNDIEFRVVQRSGSVRWVAISYQSIHAADGERLGYRTSVRDIDERKHMEEELHVMRRRAEAAAIARAELLANVSHDLRSPAHCIAGFAELLLSSDLDPAQRRKVQIIREQCTSMLRQVQDLLEYAAIEAGGVTLDVEPLDLAKLVSAAVEVAEPHAKERKLTLDAQVSLKAPWVEGDSHRITRVLTNLIDNALKFTEQGGVVIRVWDDESGVTLEVEDTGLGMDPADVQRLLQPFQQGDASVKRRRSGAGLGLAICQRFVQAMGGELDIASALGKGTCVRVRLPLPRARMPVQTELPLKGPLATSGHALVVDDSAAARELLIGMLSLFGWTASEADSGSVALALARKERFDLVLIDYQMPESDGAETAVALRRTFAARFPGQHVPIFLLTANVFAQEQLRDARSAIDAVIVKPLSRRALEELLRSAGDTSEAPGVQVDGDALDPLVIRDLLETRARTGQTMLARLLPQARAEQTRSFAALRSAAASGDTDGVARALHAIAGQAAMLGARRVADAARTLELTADAIVSLASERSHIDRLEEDWVHALEQLEMWGLDEHAPLPEPGA